MSISTLAYRDKIIRSFNNLNRDDILSLIDADSYTPENECDKLHLLGYVLYRTYSSPSGEGVSSESEKHLLFLDVEKFYESVKYCKDNIDNICDYFVKRIRLQDLSNTNEFAFSIDSLDEPNGKSKCIPGIHVANANEHTDFKIKEIAYKYIYSVIDKSYGTKGRKTILPTILFQSIFHKSDVLFRAADDSLDKIIKCEHPLSEYDDAIIKHIKGKNTRLYKVEEDNGEESLREKGFSKKSGEQLTLSEIFQYIPFDEGKSPHGIKEGLDAVGWYNYFFELCQMVSEHKSELIELEGDIICNSTNEKIEPDIVRLDSCTIPNLFDINYIAFLCLSDIFDKIFIDGKYCGLNNVDTYIYPAFRWGINRKMTHKTERATERTDVHFNGVRETINNFHNDFKQKAYKFLLEYMGIYRKRGNISQNRA